MNLPEKKTGVKNGWTAFILAGGKSRRMGRDKSRIQIDGVSLLDRVKRIAGPCGFSVKTIRTDAIPNCGPLSGIYTGLLRTRTRWCLFLGCDMPLISGETLDEIIGLTERTARPVFTESEHGFGFPLTVNTAQTGAVRSMIDDGRRSLFSAARELNSAPFRLPKNRGQELFNANTPEELAQLARALRSRDAVSRGTP